MRCLFDTNILIDYLCGREKSKDIIQNAAKPAISVISKIEILSGTEENELQITKDFLDNFEIIPVNERIVEMAVDIRNKYKLKLPNSIIWASAKSIDGLLVTIDSNFPNSASDIKIPYNI